MKRKSLRALFLLMLSGALVLFSFPAFGFAEETTPTPTPVPGPSEISTPTPSPSTDSTVAPGGVDISSQADITGIETKLNEIDVELGTGLNVYNVSEIVSLDTLYWNVKAMDLTTKTQLELDQIYTDLSTAYTDYLTATGNIMIVTTIPTADAITVINITKLHDLAVTEKRIEILLSASDTVNSSVIAAANAAGVGMTIAVLQDSLWVQSPEVVVWEFIPLADEAPVDVNLGVTTTRTADDATLAGLLTNARTGIVFDFAHVGRFPMKVLFLSTSELVYSVFSPYAGQADGIDAIAQYWDKDANTLIEDQDTYVDFVIFENAGTTALELTHASTYVVSVPVPKNPITVISPATADAGVSPVLPISFALAAATLVLFAVRKRAFVK